MKQSHPQSSRLFGTALFLPLFIARRPTPPLVVHTLPCLAKPDKNKKAEKKKKKGRAGAGGEGGLLDEDHPRQHKVEEAQRVDGEDLATCGQSGSLEEVDRGFGKRRAGDGFRVLSVLASDAGEEVTGGIGNSSES